MHGKAVQGCEILPRLPGVILRESPGAAPASRNLEDPQADRPCSHAGEADVQTAPKAPGAVLQDGPEVCVRAVHGERAPRSPDCPSGARKSGEKGEVQDSLLILPSNLIWCFLVSRFR